MFSLCCYIAAFNLLPCLCDLCCKSGSAPESAAVILHLGPHSCRLQVCSESKSSPDIIPDIPGTVYSKTVYIYIYNNDIIAVCVMLL